MVLKMKRLEDVLIPNDIIFQQMKSLSAEAIEKLSSIQPATIGQASRISGVSPSDISVLLIYLGR
jgi:tRNA uridine 5-carboxymethylaminomethyl modification enzyme